MSTPVSRAGTGPVTGPRRTPLLLRGIAVKTIRDRWLGWVVGPIFLGVMLWWGMDLYQSVDISLYTSMPDAVRSVLNIPADADAGALAYGVIYASYGALTLAALALAMGATAIAGEERAGTIGLLLANPRSRFAVLAAKTGALVALVTGGSLLMWGAAVLAPRLTGVSATGMHPGALSLHMGVNALFYGFLALAAGAWSGRTTLAAGLSTTVLVLSWLGDGLAPMVEGWAWVARWLPWYYYDEGRPVYDGVDWARLSVLVAGIVVLGLAAGVGLARRDLRERSVGVTLVDRLRANPLTHRAAERLAGSARVSGIVAKTVSESQALVVATAAVMFAWMGLLIGPVYALMDDKIKQFARDLPDSLLAMVGQADMSTATGFYQAETFSMMAPVAVALVAILAGARALAGEEAHRTMGLLLANPVSRRRVLLGKVGAMVVDALVVGTATGAGVVGGAWLGGLDLSVPNVAATSLLVTLLGLDFGAVALAVAAGCGRVRVSVWLASGAALAAYLLNSFLPLSEGLETWVRWSPFHYYLGADPLNQGMPWGDAAVLLAVFGALVGLAIVLFDRRDLRQTG